MLTKKTLCDVHQLGQSIHCYHLDGKPIWKQDLGSFKHIWGYAASPIIKKNIIDNDYILSITGRELFGLALFGYQMVTTTHGVGFTPGSKATATNANLTDYQAEIASLKKSKDAEAFFKTRGYNFRIRSRGDLHYISGAPSVCVISARHPVA